MEIVDPKAHQERFASALQTELHRWRSECRGDASARVATIMLIILPLAGRDLSGVCVGFESARRLRESALYFDDSFSFFAPGAPLLCLPCRDPEEQGPLVRLLKGTSTTVALCEDPSCTVLHPRRRRLQGSAAIGAAQPLRVHPRYFCEGGTDVVWFCVENDDAATAAVTAPSSAGGVASRFSDAEKTLPPMGMSARRMKIIAGPGGRMFLFDVGADPRETRDLVEDAAAGWALSVGKRLLQEVAV